MHSCCEKVISNTCFTFAGIIQNDCRMRFECIRSALNSLVIELCWIQKRISNEFQMSSKCVPNACLMGSKLIQNAYRTHFILSFYLHSTVSCWPMGKLVKYIWFWSVEWLVNPDRYDCRRKTFNKACLIEKKREWNWKSWSEESKNPKFNMNV